MLSFTSYLLGKYIERLKWNKLIYEGKIPNFKYMEKDNLKNETPADAKPVLSEVLLDFKEGDFVSFRGLSIPIYGYVCRINKDDSVDYIRESLTRWNTSKKMIEKGIIISEDNFISRVQNNANESGEKIPSVAEVKSALNIFKTNFDVEMSEIRLALNLA